MRDGPSRLQIVDFLFLTQRVALLCDADEQKKRARWLLLCYLCASFLFSLMPWHMRPDSVKSYMRDLAWSMTASIMYKKFPAPVVGHYVIILFLMQNPSKYFVCVSCRSMYVCMRAEWWNLLTHHCFSLSAFKLSSSFAQRALSTLGLRSSLDATPFYINHSWLNADATYKWYDFVWRGPLSSRELFCLLN